MFTKTSLSFVLLCLSASAVPAADRPNIVILLADDLGWGDVGYHGGMAATPHIDRLAREGLRLQDFHVSPLCSPTRAGLMTGRWPIRYGMGESVITPWREHGLPLTERTLADLLSGAGYLRRAAIGKWHLGHYRRAFLPLNRGFTHFYGHYNGMLDYFTHVREGQLDWHRNWDTSREPGYTTDLLGREAARFIAESPPDQPLFLYVAFNAPHTPLQAEEEKVAKFRHLEREDQRIYAAMIDSLDEAIGRVLAAIDGRDDHDNMLVLFLSDNGAVPRHGSNGPWRGGKGTVYEGGTRVPAVVRWPAGGLAGGRPIDALMGHVDIYPTLKRVVGDSTADPQPLDGIDLLDILRGEAVAPTRDWFSYIAQGSPERISLRNGEWKLVVQGGNVLEFDNRGQRRASDSQHTIELFHLDDDPGETKNLVADYPERVARLLTRLQEFRRWKLEGVPDFREGREEFVAPIDWEILQ